jgi:hypothetical protein
MFYDLALCCNDFISMLKIQVKHTDCIHVNLAAIAPEVTNPGNAAGIATGHISHTIVPLNIEKNKTMIITPNITPSFLTKFSIFFEF